MCFYSEDQRLIFEISSRVNKILENNQLSTHSFMYTYAVAIRDVLAKLSEELVNQSISIDTRLEFNELLSLSVRTFEGNPIGELLWKLDGAIEW